MHLLTSVTDLESTVSLAGRADPAARTSGIDVPSDRRVEGMATLGMLAMFSRLAGPR